MDALSAERLALLPHDGEPAVLIHSRTRATADMTYAGEHASATSLSGLFSHHVLMGGTPLSKLEVQRLILYSKLQQGGGTDLGTESKPGCAKI